jgi:RimJ/RimL family protein N-acetyltransferase
VLFRSLFGDASAHVRDRDQASRTVMSMLAEAAHPTLRGVTADLGEGVEIGWRLIRKAWGQGFATEAARAALDDGFRRMGFDEVLTYTSPTNVRSQAVMLRLGLTREVTRDFAYEVDGVTYLTVVFVAYPTTG